MKFVIKKNAKSGQFWFTIVAGNGQVLTTSEQYVAKASAVHAIESIKKGAGKAPIDDESAKK